MIVKIRSRQRRFWPATLVLLAILVGCAPTPIATVPAKPTATQSAIEAPEPTATGTGVVESNEDESYWPTDAWRTSTPEAQGMDSQRLAALFEEIAAEAYAVDSVTVIRNGHLVADATVFPFRQGERHVVHSVTKSVISALVGIAIEQGYLEGADQPIVDIFSDDDIANLDDRKRAITLEHVLMMATGLDCKDSYLYRWRGLTEMAQTDDWTQYILDLPMIEPPGTRFEYCNSASYLLSAIIQKSTGMNTWDYAEANLFAPLGIQDVAWENSPEGVTIGWDRLQLRPHDMAKFGYLYLHEGEWNGEQIVPAAWVAVSTRKHIDATLEDGYGYQWWIANDGLYLALGYAGQFIFVLPEKSLVVVFTSHLDESDFYVPQNLLERNIIPAAIADDPLPENPAGVRRLQVALTAVAGGE